MAQNNYWHVDTGAYRAAYRDAVTQAQVLPEELLSKLSTPFGFALPALYRDARVKLMIMGQETNGNEARLQGCNSWSAWARTVGEAVAFDYAYGGENSEASREFWLAYQEVCNGFGIADRRAMVWSNISKCELTEAINGRVGIMQLNSRNAVEAIAKWQKDLFLAEIRYAQPDAILFMTGGLHDWMSNAMLDGHHCKLNGEDDVCFYEVYCDEFKIPMAQTYHPNAFNVANLAERRRRATKWLKSELQSRLPF